MKICNKTYVTEGGSSQLDHIGRSYLYF